MEPKMQHPRHFGGGSYNVIIYGAGDGYRAAYATIQLVADTDIMQA